MLRRHIQDPLLEALQDFPVVLLTGARQVGKSTLAQALPGPDWRASYVTLDDRLTLDAALRDPDGFLAGTPTPVILDEVQRAPDLLRALKLIVDRGRRPGQYLLTGSANLMTLKVVSESLAGRMALHELYPFSWPEMQGKPAPTVLEDLYDAPNARALLERWPKGPPSERRQEIQGLILTGGYPTPAMMRSPASRARWFEAYRKTYLERDLRDIAAIANLPDFDRLLTLVALRTGQLLNFSEISRELGLPLTTVRRYLNLLETTYQVFLVPPYFTNIGKRLVKTPKLYVTDTGMACHLAAVENWQVLERQGRVGALVETWVATELRKLISLGGRYQLYFWRTHAGREVDFLVERGEELVAIEVKWTGGIGDSDLAGFKDCAQALGERLRFSVLLYPGTEVVALGSRTVAVPFSTFLGVA